MLGIMILHHTRVHVTPLYSINRCTFIVRQLVKETDGTALRLEGK